MGSGMPYYHEVGPTWQYFNSYFAQSDPEARVRHKLATLEALWRDPRFTRMGDTGFTLHSTAPVAALTVEQPWSDFFHSLVYHANADWFGWTTNAAVNPLDSETDEYTVPPLPFGFDVDHQPTTGWWKNWYGRRTEEIVRTAFIRAIEVSLALDHPTKAVVDAAPPLVDRITTFYGGAVQGGLTVKDLTQPAGLAAKFDRNWPVDFWWTCGLPWFQAYVTWADQSAAQGLGRQAGRVTVNWLTPSSTVHNTLWDFSNAPLAPEGPTAQTERFGSWLVTHKKNKLTSGEPYAPTTSGVSPSPISVTYSYGDVVVVEPPFVEGGAGQPDDLVALWTFGPPTAPLKAF